MEMIGFLCVADRVGLMNTSQRAKRLVQSVAQSDFPNMTPVLLWLGFTHPDQWTTGIVISYDVGEDVFEVYYHAAREGVVKTVAVHDGYGSEWLDNSIRFQ